MLRECKYIIFRKDSKLKHFIFPYSNSHYYFARDNGINDMNIIETGLLIGSKISVLECKNKIHLDKIRHKNLDLNEYHNLRLAREANSRYIYKYKLDGD
jgi:hypothetical protein